MWLTGSGSVQRFHVESATVLWVAVGSLVRTISSVDDPVDSGAPSPILNGVPEWAGWIGLALALYWPALGVGLLSDDFVLADRARQWLIGPVGAQLFRPLPLAVWATILSLGGGARSFHLLNVVLHGVNAGLASHVIRPSVPSRIWSTIGGLVVLTLPLAPEAVVWCSGVFDVAMTTIICGAVLVARRYESSSQLRWRAGLFGLAAAALLTKETAVALPLIVLLDMFARRKWPARLLIDLGALIAASLVFALWRLSAPESAVVRQPVTKYLVQRWLFRSFGSLALPWHQIVVERHAWMAATGLTVVVLLIAFFFSTRVSSRAQTRRVAASAGWTLASVVPTAALLLVTPDLQGARYLYLASIGWGALLTICAAEARRVKGQEIVTVSLVGLLVAIGAVGVRMHLRPWTGAAALRDRIERSAASNEAMRTCAEISLAGLPDAYEGAYVFRNGAAEAFSVDLGLRVTGTGPARSCAFRWDDARFVADSDPAVLR